MPYYDSTNTLPSWLPLGISSRNVLLDRDFKKKIFCSPSAGPGFPGYPLPPFSQATQGSSAPAPPTSTGPPSSDQGAGQGTGQGATPTQEASTGGGRRGLFHIGDEEISRDGEHQIESSSSEEQGSGSGASVLPAWAGEQGRDVGISSSSDGSDGSVTTLTAASSTSHVDSDIRQRRLARLHSQPSTSQQSLSPLAEKEGELATVVGENRKEQDRTDSANGETEV